MKFFWIENDLEELLYEDDNGVKKYATWAHESEVENSFKVVKYSDYTNLLEQAMKVREAYYEYTISKNKNDLDKTLTELCNFLEGKHGN